MPAEYTSGGSAAATTTTTTTTTAAASPLSASGPLHVQWDRTRAIVNLRGDPADAGFVHAVGQALGLPLPVQAGGCPAHAGRRIVWAGPDDWFVIGEPGTEHAIAQALREAAGARHHAVTDVSSGYAVLELGGAPVHEVLAQGCPLDLHPRAFPVGRCAGTHFFKASVWLWRCDAQRFGLLVRTSFAGYVGTMIEACTREIRIIEEA